LFELFEHLEHVEGVSNISGSVCSAVVAWVGHLISHVDTIGFLVEGALVGVTESMGNTPGVGDTSSGTSSLGVGGVIYYKTKMWHIIGHVDAFSWSNIPNGIERFSTVEEILELLVLGSDRSLI
jgi:hypothetical protein